MAGRGAPQGEAIREFALPSDVEHFRKLIYYYGYSRLTFGDIERLANRPNARRKMTIKDTERKVVISLRGSTATPDDAIFLRALLEPLQEKEQLHLKDLLDAGFISNSSWTEACAAMGCDIDCDNMEVVLQDAETRHLVNFLRDLDDFVEFLGGDKPRGEGPLFERKYPGVFDGAAKMYDTFRNIYASRFWRSSRTTPTGTTTSKTAFDNLLSEDSNDSPPPPKAQARQSNVLYSDPEEVNKVTRYGRTDEERQTNFATAWWNALCNYHNSTRRLCTLVPDRTGFTLVSRKDGLETESQMKKTLKRQKSFVKVFAAYSDGVVPRRTHGPVPPKLHPDQVLMTVELKPPGLRSGNQPHETIMVQVAFEIASRIAALHDPTVEGASPSNFSGEKHVLVVTLCGFECVLIRASYCAEWLQYVQYSGSTLLQKDLKVTDFLRIKRIGVFNLLQQSRDTYILNAVLLSIFIEEYKSGSTQTPVARKTQGKASLRGADASLCDTGFSSDLNGESFFEEDSHIEPYDDDFDNLEEQQEILHESSGEEDVSEYIEEPKRGRAPSPAASVVSRRSTRQSEKQANTTSAASQQTPGSSTLAIRPKHKQRSKRP